jgi:hypothetical protein
MGAQGSTAGAGTARQGPEWIDLSSAEQADAMKAISLMSPNKFLEVRSPLPELDDVVWSSAWEENAVVMEAYKAYAAAAVQRDHALNRMVYKCVPKRVPESEFWRCFFSWAYYAINALDEEAGGASGLAAIAGAMREPPPLIDSTS